MASKDVKKRYWALIGYPESLPDNWLDILQETGLQCAVSPLHDKDVNPDGEVKKPHYHIILVYAGPTSYNVVKRIADSLNAPDPKYLESIRGYYRYFTHKDNPEKYQYDEKDIRTVNGFSIADYVELTRSEIVAIKAKIQRLIREMDILEYSDLLDILLDSDMSVEYEVATCNTFRFEKYISSRRNKGRN